MSDFGVNIFFDSMMLEHRPGAGHPERPGRLQAIDEHLQEHYGDLKRQTAKRAVRTDLERIHDPEYVDDILELRGKRAVLDADTVVSSKSVDAALLAAGIAGAAVESAIVDGIPAMALVRPPGHHAEGGRAMGFCIFNNIAVAVARAIDELDVERALIIDWDVHHGNGTQHAFYDRSDVLFFSTHQSPLYPGTGSLDEIGGGDGVGYTVNIPLPAGTGDAGLVEAFETILVPAAQEFEPDFVAASAGFDAHRRDPVGGMEVTSDGFSELLSIVRNLADELCAGRLSLILEGGYDLEALATCVGRCIDGLSGAEISPDFGPPKPGVSRVLRNARKFHGWG